MTKDSFRNLLPIGFCRISQPLAASVLLLALGCAPVVAQTLETECVTASPCALEQKPLWEVGVAGAVVYGPDYPAAGESRSNQLVLPYFIYRGEVIRAGEDGLIKAHAFEDERWELDISVDGAFSADSDDNDAREGMDDLDYLLGIGPEIKYHIYRTDNGQRDLTLEFQLRSVFSTDLSNLKQRGYAFETQLRYEHKRLFDRNIKFVGSVGPVWATEKLMDYFYQVDERDVTPTRTQFDANGGYLGTDLSIGLVFDFLEKRGRIFVGGQASFHQQAENEDSPLFRDDTTFGVGVGFSYRLYQSDEVVYRR